MLPRLPFDRNLLVILMLCSAMHASKLMANSADSANWSVEFDLNSGFGVFSSLRPPDLFDPANLEGLDPTSQSGIPVVLSLTPSYGHSSLLWYANLNWAQLNTIDAPVPAADSQYKRYHLGSGVAAKLSGLIGQPWITLELGYRIVDYLNISSGHYVESLLPKVGLRSNLLDNWRGEIKIGFVAAGEFGYHDGSKRQPLEPSEVTGRSFTARLDYLLSRESSIFFAIDHESYQVELANTVAYQDFGFSILPQQRVARGYKLDADIFQLGVRRVW